MLKIIKLWWFTFKIKLKGLKEVKIPTFPIVNL